jgi:hypothetical protein
MAQHHMLVCVLLCSNFMSTLRQKNSRVWEEIKLALKRGEAPTSSEITHIWYHTYKDNVT